MSWFLFVLGVLAVYRLSHMLSSEEGPAAIFSKMRRKVPAKTNPGRGIRCPLCWSVWVSFAVAGFYWWLGLVPPLLSPLYSFALSGAAVLLHKFDGAD